MINVINFTHPFTAEQIDQLVTLINQRDANITAEDLNVVNIKVQFDFEADYAEQIKAFVKAIPVPAEELQTIPVVVNLPALASVAGGVLAALHGICGYFPMTIVMKPVDTDMGRKFVISELVSLGRLRDQARTLR